MITPETRISQLASPDIDVRLDMAVLLTSGGQACYAGNLYGDRFPDAEVFIINSQKQSRMLLTFTTPGGPNIGPIAYLPGDGTDNMGLFSDQCLAK